MKKWDLSAAGQLGLSEEGLQAAWSTLDKAIEQGVIPGGVALIGRRGDAAAYAAGHAFVSEEHSIPASVDTIYDCASLTKVVVTLALTLILTDRGQVRLADPVAQHIPAFGAAGKTEITIGQLLAHTSGLPAHRDLYSHGWTPQQIHEEICAMEPDYPPGTRCVYSCLGYIILGHIIRQQFGRPLEEAAWSEVLQPLGMTASRYNPPPEWKPRIAATEYDAGLGEYRWGFVHDENAHALGGAAGNAGLFSTASDLLRYARMWLALAGSASGAVSYVDGAVDASLSCTGPEGFPESLLLSREAVKEALRSHTLDIPGAHRGLGWVLRGDPADVTGERLSPFSFGHTGFTGTSLWIDPAQDLILILLTNRVHYGRGNSIAALRRQFHEAAAAAIQT
ncbi:beta-lactamase family protein [Paenibacillus thiaminolyticus]|uniref:Beta-lactamase family protein n=1 Tax=Paenibacillus thiaminolyticus TaxID=49283 RepID=A0AAP9DX76_PANTH|nr:serine hydrolase domain-containing protein [Paenibacillus thiaminolyticus]MCY9538907.1 beta-lactamase family protein [Paenibacillus thiaminolyticus]MCY9605532.1 beta-lactamase family protein [Paenibacillus thiaminolyticus]MCY9609895.1 beta-lactamase family protein [Paenibacillus thiaminolyticus]MCY9613839.1 beta-lactamase family protein [Paenibacillus thiaminolyticus]MCY9620741.1 beta-lactamase family protein [Paenibacillus thiaminolyticus]